MSWANLSQYAYEIKRLKEGKLDRDRFNKKWGYVNNASRNTETKN